MSYQIRQPINSLRPYIRYLAISTSGDPQRYTVLPDTSLVIGFQFKGRVSYVENDIEQPLHKNGITGLLDGYRVFSNTTETGSILVAFTETGSANFLDVPMNELFGQSLSLEHFFKRAAISDTQEKLEAAQTDNDRLRIIENFLLIQIKERKGDQLVAGALHHIFNSKGTIRMTTLAALLNTSQSPLEKRFRAIVGASPKKFSGIVRAKNVMEALNNNNESAVEHLSAFYDQSHFIKDFKKFSSMTPEQYLRVIRAQSK